MLESDLIFYHNLVHWRRTSGEHTLVCNAFNCPSKKILLPKTFGKYIDVPIADKIAQHLQRL